jgi:hypothetical protein
MMQEPRDLCADIERLGLTHWGLARIMQQLGDDRDHHNILRHMQRVVTGERYNGEMRVVMRLLEERMNNTPLGTIKRATRPAWPSTHAAESPALQTP